MDKSSVKIRVNGILYEREVEPRGPEPGREALRDGVARDAPEALGEPLGVAVLAARADLAAPRHRVPSRVAPLDPRDVGHRRRWCLWSNGAGPRSSMRRCGMSVLLLMLRGKFRHE